jgi:hypothetical protein
MPQTRAFAQISMVLLFLAVAALLSRANRGGPARLWSTCVVVAGVLVAILFLTDSRTRPSDWPLWGTSLVVALVAAGMAFTVALLGTDRVGLAWQIAIVAAMGGILYIASNVLLMLLFPGLFWI